MILLELRDYLRGRGQASLQDLVQHFSSDPESMRAMLAQLIRKGQVRSSLPARPSHGHCGDCTHCDPTIFEIYYWGESKTSGRIPCTVQIQATTPRV